MGNRNKDDEYSAGNFTNNYLNDFYDTVDRDEFQDFDSDYIFDALKNRIKPIPFGDYLKRYIFLRENLEGDFRSIDIKFYQNILVTSFRESGVPQSFAETTAKLSALAKNWLTQFSVKRNIVFLLGFGLGLSVGDVSEFLVNALKERDINFKDSFEILCWYCYKNNYPFSRFSELKSRLERVSSQPKSNISDLRTTFVKDSFFDIGSDDELIQRLSELKPHARSVSVTETFNRLYETCKEIIAEMFNADEDERFAERVAVYIDRISRTDRLSDEEKIKRINKFKTSRSLLLAKDITESDVEMVLCCGMPKDRYGNMLNFSKSNLSKHFYNKRMSSQHLYELLAGKQIPDRFDLITLNFFIFSQDETLQNPKIRYMKFLDETDAVLTDCSMSGLYIANPYECFVMMCLLAECPLAVYSDVLELSFEEGLTTP